MFFFCILQGLSVLELHSDSLHTAAECYNGMEAAISHPDPLKQPNLALRCLETAAGGNFVENYSVECNRSADCGYCETGNEHKVRVLPASVPKPQVGLAEHGPGPSEDWVCPSPSTGRDDCHTEEEAKETPIVSTSKLNLFHRSEGAQRELERQTLTVGIEAAAAAHSKQAEDSAGLEAVIQEGLEATAGKETSEQEAEECTARRRQEETTSAELSSVSRGLEASIMGQNSSSKGSSSETKECCQDGENAGKELLKDDQKLCDGLCLDGALPAPGATPGEEPCPLIEGGDVIRGPGSPVPYHLIEGLHDGEPPPDINSLEQKQEAAVQDYAVEQEWDLAPQTAGPAGSCSEADGVKELDGENAPEVPGCSPELSLSHHIADIQALGHPMEGAHTDSPLGTTLNEESRRADSGLTCGLFGVGAFSLQAIESSTETFHPSQDCVRAEKRDYLEPGIAAAAVETVEGENDWKPEENLLNAEAGFPSKLESGPKTCAQTKRTGEEAGPEASTEETGPAPANEVAEISDSKPGESGSSEYNGETAHVEAEVTDACSLTSEVISAGAEAVQPTDVGNNLHPEPEDPIQVRSEITQEQRLPDDRLTLSEDVTQPLDKRELAVEIASTTGLTSRPQSVGNQSSDSPEAPGTLEGARQSAIQGEQTLIVLCLSHIRFSLVIDTHTHTDQAHQPLYFTFS